MGIDIDGWVEVTHSADSSEHWFGLLNLSPLIDVCDRGSVLLFGIGNGWKGDCPIAMERGLPANPSYQTLRDIQDIKTFEDEEKGCANEHFGYTHLYYSELLRPAFAEEYGRLAGTQWGPVIKLIEALIDSGRYQPEQVRFVVWACI
ncbi:hypothetical protein [Hahella sp. HN01]|uniref:hypothetical protein n=1 Tax=Hahella sp. HN01 TaxID=2847262 RepID=UPI001C1F03A8|nr:hypothetical protein [Hahella sp. HN01]MBU6953314.1 hypothetical protein [Hahella sp. HN01]